MEAHTSTETSKFIKLFLASSLLGIRLMLGLSDVRATNAISNWAVDLVNVNSSIAYLLNSII